MEMLNITGKCMHSFRSIEKQSYAKRIVAYGPQTVMSNFLTNFFHLKS